MASRSVLLCIGLATAFAGTALAHGDDHGKPAIRHPVEAQQKPFGIAGDGARVSRTIDIAMTDDMRFSPAAIHAVVGETIRFRLTNEGRALHEMVIGTLTDLHAHAATMQKGPGMQHDAPYMAHVKPGASAEIVWTFNRPGEFTYACLVPGHFEAGMSGKVVVAN